MSHKSKHNKNNPASKQEHSEGREETTNRHVYVEPGVQIDLVKDLKEKYESSQTQSSTHNDKVLLWSKIGAGLIFVYAAITLLQTCLVYRDEGDRPWVGIETFTTNGIQEGQKFVFTMLILNRGRRPAKVAVKGPKMQDYDKFPKNPTYEKQTTSIGLILPDGHLKVSLPLTVIQPGLHETLKNSGHTLYIHTAIEYEDVTTHERHWTHWCVQYSPESYLTRPEDTFNQCLTYNDAN
ncbi:MAG TPA: hypothetical protein VKA07_12620 [Candidatus Sulfotelmatobacter sp.]|nr:hypothetical protein [Candidatus Sulfotelmatobacter sp.]